MLNVPKLVSVIVSYTTLGQIYAGLIELPANVQVNKVTDIDGTNCTLELSGAGLEEWALMAAVLAVLTVGSSSSGIYSVAITSSGV